MTYRLRTMLLSTLGIAALGAGCASTNSEAQTPDTTYVVDQAVVAGVMDVEDDLVGSGAAVLDGAAVWEEATVGDWMALAATSPEERARAEAAGASGAYLGDARRIARLQPGDAPGSAGVTVDEPVETAFETEILHRFDGGGGRVDLTFAGAPTAEGRRMPSLLRVSFFLDAAEESRVVVYLGGAEGEPSELASALLPQDTDRGAFAHRFDVQYQPGQVVVLLNGEPVVEAAARLGGGPMTVTVAATAPAETRAYLLRWVLDTGE